ncbi:MAG: sigma-54-dependent Fis family transcriptional regulator [Planctomycetia bacterium]|nr:sigma-54-dependent Fis family transcriptional regulator [Planctomycetia bacterium]
MSTILIIDDDIELGRFLQQGLQEQGHRVTYLERADEAPALLAGGGFEVILVDNKMPGMSGIDFLGIIKQRGLNLPVILMTGHATVDTAIRAMNLGAFDYVIKPSDYDQLQLDLQPVLDLALTLSRPVPKVRLHGEEFSYDPAKPILLGQSQPMTEVGKRIGQFARGNDPVLVLGETGTGKELVARAIHTNSPRKERPFMALNCTALSEHLLDDELFGHEPGAFTGADKLRKGRFEYAHGGTLFLDELGDMPLPLQAKLLRVLETQEVCRIGSNEVIRVDVRIVSATHRDLEELVARNTFRQDLMFRLNRLVIHLPPLRERAADVVLLAERFLARFAPRGSCVPTLHDSARAKLLAHTWPGNVRELQTVISRALQLCRGAQIMPADLDLPTCRSAATTDADPQAQLHELIRWAWQSGQPRLSPLLMEMLERELLRFALAALDGNQTQVAERLGLARGTVIDRLRKYGLK